MNVKDYVKNCTVQFKYYRDSSLYYEVIGGPTELFFPVPISDIGGATFKCEDKAVLFMRYIRKHIDLLNGIGYPIIYGCVTCEDSGIRPAPNSPSGTFMIPCEDCDAGKD